MALLRESEGPFAKDSCHFCFVTQFDGLHLSTVTKRAYCKKHLSLHYKQYPDDIYYIHILKTKKPVSEEREHKILKLEINYAKDSDLFDIWYSIVQYDGQEIKHVETSPSDESIINKVKTSTSSSKTQELKSWQLEIQPCPHTLSYEPSIETSIDLSNLQCSSCELDQNLWLCLICGSLGCGRAQFGGVPGNTHALAHSQSAEHFIAIKLGSLTKDVVDVYCYKCDEEVSFPPNINMFNILKKNFNVDLDKFEKKEKGLLELQIEQNLEWEFNLKDSNGNFLTKLFGPGLTGLKNLGNSCYLNSVLQLLFSIEEYQERFNTEMTKESIEESLSFELTKLANGLLSGEFSKPNPDNSDGYQTGIALDSMKYKISEDNEEFRSMKQQDAMEFFAFLLNKIDELDPELNDVFKFVNIEKFKFNDEQNSVKFRRQIDESLSLPIKFEVDRIDEDGNKIYQKQSFFETLLDYLNPEEIELNSKIVLKSNFFKTFPKYLITTLQRIQLENWNPIKVDVPVTIPNEFDLKNLQPDQLILPGETEIHDDDDEFEEFVPNETALEQLEAMGFPAQRSKRALFENNNNSNVEQVMEWLFQKMEDDSLDEPFDFKIKKDKKPQIDQEKISALGDMGFCAKLATKALILNNQDVNGAVEWLFSNPNDDGELPKTINKDDKLNKLESQDSETSSKYVLKGVVCHKGTQVTSGHYVVFIKDEINDRWILFNDEKVVDVTNDEISWSEIEKNGYVYLWKRV